MGNKDCETLSEELEEEDIVDTEGCESDFEECLLEGNSEALCTEQYEDCVSSIPHVVIDLLSFF